MSSRSHSAIRRVIYLFVVLNQLLELQHYRIEFAGQAGFNNLVHVVPYSRQRRLVERAPLNKGGDIASEA